MLRSYPPKKAPSRAARFALLCLVGTLQVACASPALAQSVDRSVVTADRSGSTLEVGDMVRITVWRRPELSGDFRIGADSVLRHPLYQQVRLAGLTLRAAQTSLETYLRQLEAAPQLVLEPIYRVAVGGEIRQPNLYSLPPETSIAQVVALAGGPTERGRLDRVRLIRGGRVTMLDMTSAAAGVTDMPIQSGDQIVIGRRRAVFRDVVLPVINVLGGAAALITVFRQ